MWAPSIGLTFKAISTTCRDTRMGRMRDSARKGVKKRSKEKQTRRRFSGENRRWIKEEVCTMRDSKGQTQDDVKTSAERTHRGKRELVEASFLKDNEVQKILLLIKGLTYTMWQTRLVP